MTIVEFLRARLDEDEAAARACKEVFPSPWDVTDRGHSATVRADEPHFPIVTALEQSDAIDGWLGDRLTHFVRHDPARVLADVEAKRRIVEEVAAGLELSQDWRTRDKLKEAQMWLLLRYLALPYADHPDYDEAWRP